MCEWDKEIHDLGLPLLGDGRPVQWTEDLHQVRYMGEGAGEGEGGGGGMKVYCIRGGM